MASGDHCTVAGGLNNIASGTDTTGGEDLAKNGTLEDEGGASVSGG